MALIRFDNPVFRIQTTAKDSQSYIFIALPIGLGQRPFNHIKLLYFKILLSTKSYKKLLPSHGIIAMLTSAKNVRVQRIKRRPNSDLHCPSSRLTCSWKDFTVKFLLGEFYIRKIDSKERTVLSYKTPGQLERFSCG